MDLPIDVAYNKISAFKLYLQETVVSMEPISEQEDIDAHSPVIILEVEKYTSSIVREICLSLISGEYFTNHEINNRLDSAENEIKDFPRYANTLSDEIQKRVLESSNVINVIIENYKIFIKDIIDRYSEEQNFYLFAQNSHFEEIINGSDLSEDYEKFVNYFITLLGVVRLENFPTTHKEYIMEVFEYGVKINRITINEYSDISTAVETKVAFLKHKWKKRIENINPYHSNYLEGGTLKTIEDFNGDNETINNWVSIIDTQYDIISNNWKDIIKKRVASYKNNPLSSLSILQIHQLVKYYKDVKPSLSKLNEIALFLKNKADTIVEENSFTKYAYNIIYNYTINNVFSLYISKEQSIKNITEKYKEIRDSIKGSVNNYFLRFKYLEYLVNYLQSKILNDEKINFLNAYSDLIEDCHEEMQECTSSNQLRHFSLNP